MKKMNNTKINRLHEEITLKKVKHFIMCVMDVFDDHNEMKVKKLKITIDKSFKVTCSVTFSKYSRNFYSLTLDEQHKMSEKYLINQDGNRMSNVKNIIRHILKVQHCAMNEEILDKVINSLKKMTFLVNTDIQLLKDKTIEITCEKK